MNNTYSQNYMNNSFNRYEVTDLVVQSAVFSGFAATVMGEAWRPMAIVGATASLIRCLTIPLFKQFEGRIDKQLLLPIAQLANLALAIVIVKSVMHIHIHLATTAIFSLLLTYGYNLIVGRSMDYKQTYIIV